MLPFTQSIFAVAAITAEVVGFPPLELYPLNSNFPNLLPFVGNAFLPKEIIDPKALFVFIAGLLLEAGLTVKPPLKVEAVDVLAPLPVTVANVSASAKVLAIVIVPLLPDIDISLPSAKVTVLVELSLPVKVIILVLIIIWVMLMIEVYLH